MPFLLAHDDGSFTQKDVIDSEDLERHDNGEIVILALHEGKFCIAAVDRKGDNLEIAVWNPV